MVGIKEGKKYQTKDGGPWDTSAHIKGRVLRT